MDWSFANLFMWALSTPVVFYFGRDFFTNALEQARHRSANMDTLVALSTGIAYVFSVFNLLFADFLHQKGFQSHVYFESALLLLHLFCSENIWRKELRVTHHQRSKI